MRHRPVQTGAGPPFSLSLHFHFQTPVSPERRERYAERTALVPMFRGCKARNPHPAWNSGCGPPLGAPRPGRFEAVFRRSAPHSAVGPRRCNLFRTLRHPLARWGSSMQLPHFRLPPALAGLRLLLRSYLRSPATRHRLSQAPHSRSASGSLLKRRSLRERGEVIILLMDLSRRSFGPSFETPALRAGTRMRI